MSDASKENIEPQESSESGSSVVRVLDLIEQCGGIDGSHHKQWLLDEIVQILSPDYSQWVKDYEAGEDGPNTYTWDVGIAP